MNNIYNMLSYRITNTALAIMVFITLFALLRYIVSRFKFNQKKRQRVNARIFYILTVIFSIVFARIWIEGFNSIFTVLGLVSAALVVSNKETIMNLVGWVIISWRGLFSDNDFIEINKLSGYVHKVGILYFSLSNKKVRDCKHAQLIKIPNGLVVNNHIINFSQTDALYPKQLQLVFTIDSDYELGNKAFKAIIEKAIKHTLQIHRAGEKGHYPPHVDENYLLQSIKMNLRLSHEKPVGIVCTWHFDCYFCCQDEVENLIWKEWLKKLPTLDNVSLSLS